MRTNKETFVIKDWAGNEITDIPFRSFDDAESYLSEFLGKHYDDERGEYVIQEENYGDESDDLETLGHSSRQLASRNGYTNKI